MISFQGAVCVSLEGDASDLLNRDFRLLSSDETLSLRASTPLALLDKSLLSAVEERRLEYVAGRACATLALSQLGATDLQVARAPNRLPIWPMGFVGSISHTQGFVVACVSRASECRSLGVDVENLINENIREEICERVFAREEILLLDSVSSLKSQESFTVGFCAKEATYKAIYPLDETYRDFLDLRLDAIVQTASDSQKGIFRIADLKTQRQHSGEWCLNSKRVLSFLAIR